MGKKICDSGARVEVEEAIDDELQKARFIHCDGLFSTKYFLKNAYSLKRVTHMREHLVNPKTCSFVRSTGYIDVGPIDVTSPLACSPFHACTGVRFFQCYARTHCVC